MSSISRPDIAGRADDGDLETHDLSPRTMQRERARSWPDISEADRDGNVRPKGRHPLGGRLNASSMLAQNASRGNRALTA